MHEDPNNDEPRISGDADALRAAAQGDTGGHNLLADLRRMKDEAGDESRHEEFEIPHYRGRLAIQVFYRASLWDEFKKISRRVEKDKSKRKELYAHADTLVLCTHQIVVKKDDKWHALGECFPEYIDTEEDRGLPLTFSDRVVCEMFDLERPDGKRLASADDATSREVVLALFNNPLSVTSVHNEVAEWLQGLSASQESEGESSGLLR